MTDYRYLIIGDGMTGAAAANAIREVDRQGSIGIISAEPDAPYSRPPLSKGLWKGDSLDGIWCETGEPRPELHLGRTVRTIIPDQKLVIDAEGKAFRYAKLLLATGGTPRRLRIANEEQ